MVQNYKVVTLCGSTRFKEQFIETQKRLTAQQRLLWRALFRSDFEVRQQALGDFLQKEHVQMARYLCQTFRDMLAGENKYGMYRWIGTACVLVQFVCRILLPIS